MIDVTCARCIRSTDGTANANTIAVALSPPLVFDMV
jgi:hypothetical protein